jgi:NAD(P)-dependent dehydrogenase (short-subunit alcohol dehydrogenase family)
MSGRFDGKVIAISGAGKGLGRAYALHLARLGASVVVNNRSHSGESSADQTVQQIVQSGGRAVVEYSAVESPAAGRNLLDCALDNFGRLDAVIANAGISERKSFHKQTLDEFRQIIEINLIGTANILHAAFAHMFEQQSGRIVVSTSVAGLFGEHGLPAYSTSKAGLLGLMYALSLEGAAKGVHVNAIAPYAATRMTRDHLTEEMESMLDAEKVAPVVAWLVSDDCSVNGKIVISGAGKTACARVMTSAGLLTPELSASVWERLELQPLDEKHESAIGHFQTFVQEIERKDSD